MREEERKNDGDKGKEKLREEREKGDREGERGLENGRKEKKKYIGTERKVFGKKTRKEEKMNERNETESE